MRPGTKRHCNLAMKVMWNLRWIGEREEHIVHELYLQYFPPVE